MMVRAAARLTLLALMLSASSGEAGNQVIWTVHVADSTVPLPAALFDGRPLPTKGSRWSCVADKALRQDASGNTFSTLTIRCNDGETTVSSSASCSIGAHDNKQLAFELLEKTTGLKNAIRAECTDGF
ncbi:MAG TPA: hypothetical protein VMI75_04435 [Polyangiaceae bacterium]|nr:hypothetical protein [Polyangiaceae bacterium]